MRALSSHPNINEEEKLSDSLEQHMQMDIEFPEQLMTSDRKDSDEQKNLLQVQLGNSPPLRNNNDVCYDSDINVTNES